MILPQNGALCCMATKNRVTINLDDDDFEALTKLSKSADRPLAYLGRMAVRRLVNEELSQLAEVRQEPYFADKSAAE